MRYDIYIYVVRQLRVNVDSKYVSTGLLRFYIIFSVLSYIVFPMAPQVNVVHTGSDLANMEATVPCLLLSPKYL